MEGSTVDIIANLDNIRKEIPDGVKLVAVSKTKPAEVVMIAYNQGQRIFGENKIQELTYKHESLPKDIEWHMIGHLQTNKVKYIAGFISLVHSVDSFKLLKQINKEAKKKERVVDCLLQVKIAKEETKFGLDFNGVTSILGSEEFATYENVRVRGLMGMASNSENIDEVRGEFKKLKETFVQIKLEYFKDKDYFSEISMGMSHDFPIAIEEGATLVRVGSSIFGERNYV